MNDKAKLFMSYFLNLLNQTRDEIDDDVVHSFGVL